MLRKWNDEGTWSRELIATVEMFTPASISASAIESIKINYASGSIYSILESNSKSCMDVKIWNIAAIDVLRIYNGSLLLLF